MKSKDQSRLAVKVARLYFYQGLNTETIASELKLSRSAVSRLLTFARQSGLVEIRVHDPQHQPQELEQAIRERFGLKKVSVVSVPPNSREEEWLKRVASFAASHLNNLIHSDLTVGVAWGSTLDAISRALTPKHCARVNIVQLTGSSSTEAVNNYYTSEIYTRFAENYGARAYLFPVPAFFDYPETKRAMWRERSIQEVTGRMRKADLLVYSVGVHDSRLPSYIYVAGYLNPKDFREFDKEKVVGNIATMFFRADGSFEGIPLNERASGPDLSVIRRARHALCVVSGLGKVNALRGALLGRLMTELIVDEPTAHELMRE